MSLIEQVPRIETRRLVLRAPQAADIGRIASLADDFEIARMTACMPHPYGLADAEAFVARAQAIDPAREAVFVIELEDEGAIGAIGLHPCGSFAPEIGYWIGRPYWGRGLASEAAGAALDWAGGAWSRRAVFAGYFTDNPASGRVLERAGFLHTGEVQHRHSRARGGPAPTRMMVWLA
ncbi:MAG: GNAT family N-acetyltransferase [Caulobacteraceae bacterium]|nr:GNAT family N-acetyltransferase [Caulobacteraceae bacterium]